MNGRRVPSLPQTGWRPSTAKRVPRATSNAWWWINCPITTLPIGLEIYHCFIFNRNIRNHLLFTVIFIFSLLFSCYSVCYSVIQISCPIFVFCSSNYSTYIKFLQSFQTFLHPILHSFQIDYHSCIPSIFVSLLISWTSPFFLNLCPNWMCPLT